MHQISLFFAIDSHYRAVEKNYLWDDVIAHK